MESNISHFDTIVVGSGPGGGSVAKHLTQLGQHVAIIEMGNTQPLEGRFTQMIKMAAIPGRGAFIHSDLSLVMRAITTGGSSVINFATATPPPLARFQALGINLDKADQSIQQQLSPAPLPESLFGPMAKKIQQSAVALGHNWQPLKKFIDPQLCRPHCHRCAFGCPNDAKWNARMWVEEAVSKGAMLYSHAKVKRVLIQDGVARGISFLQKGHQQQLTADNIVLAAGGIGTPRILASSGINNACDNYFVDPVVAVMGQVDNLQGGYEVPMAAGLALPEHGITLSDLTLPKPLHQLFSGQVGQFSALRHHQNNLCIMVKIADQPGGRIGPYWINKRLSLQDRQRLERGQEIAQNILQHAGATKIFKSHHFAAHPGGSATIGKVVDHNLKTEVDGLYLCDASILPAPWGMAPSYTLLCLGHRLAGEIASH